jgi:hypothetical protein
MNGMTSGAFYAAFNESMDLRDSPEKNKTHEVSTLKFIPERTYDSEILRVSPLQIRGTISRRPDLWGIGSSWPQSHHLYLDIDFDGGIWSFRVMVTYHHHETPGRFPSLGTPVLEHLETLIIVNMATSKDLFYSIAYHTDTTPLMTKR